MVPALSGDQALEHFNSGQTFDLLITDIVMPEKLQGHDLARVIRQTNPEMPVIFMSGYAREGTVHGKGIRSSDIRLMKPVSKNDLIGSIQAALQFNAVLVP